MIINKIIIIIIKSLFQAMPIKVRCTMYSSSNVNPHIKNVDPETSAIKTTSILLYVSFAVHVPAH